MFRLLEELEQNLRQVLLLLPYRVENAIDHHLIFIRKLVNKINLNIESSTPVKEDEGHIYPRKSCYSH